MTTAAHDFITSSATVVPLDADLAGSVTSYASRFDRQMRRAYGDHGPNSYKRWLEQQAAREYLQQDARDQAEQAEAAALHDELLEEHRRRLEARQQMERDTFLADLWERAHRGVRA